jgi:hypothetical protein
MDLAIHQAESRIKAEEAVLGRYPVLLVFPNFATQKS